MERSISAKVDSKPVACAVLRNEEYRIPADRLEEPIVAAVVVVAVVAVVNESGAHSKSELRRRAAMLEYTG